MKQGTKLLRILALALIIVMGLLVVGEAMATRYPYETVSMDDVNLRKTASTKSSILKKINAGETVTVLGSAGSFYKVKYNGTTGYAMKSYLDGIDPGPDVTVDPSVKTGETLFGITAYPYDTTIIYRVKFRKTAAENGEVIKTLTAGTTVRVFDRTDNGFVKVKVNGQVGYVADTHIILADIAAPTPKPTPTPVPGSEKYSSIRLGDSGEAVTALQNALVELGFLDKEYIDGNFGAKTESALKVYQKRNGMTQDGVASAQLQVKLFEGISKDSRGYRQYVKTLPPVAGAVIKSGSIGTYITTVQARLAELGYYTAEEYTTVCDANTTAAILLFEGVNGLVADGELSSEDQDLLFSGKAMRAGETATPAPTAVPVITSTLKKGSRGDDVMTLQQRLTELDYYTGEISGYFGDETVAAVKSFQSRNALTVDGILGAVSRTVLFGSNAVAATDALPADSVSNTTADEITPGNTITIKDGSNGEHVLKLQQRLQALGYYTSRLDGIYLSDDKAAVKAFQKVNGLTADGKAGYQTQSVLYSDSAIGNSTAVTESETLKLGSKGDAVSKLQTRLIERGYLKGKADGVFGKNTRTAVRNFQKANKLTADGVAGESTLNALNSSSSIVNTNSTTLRIGMVSNAVTEMQNRLITLGYLTGKADGIFGTKTSLALIAFQKANKLTADGIAGKKTLAALGSNTAVNANGASVTPPTVTPSAPSISGIKASDVKYEMWYSGLRNKAKSLPNVTVYDFSTGISWKLNMFSLGAHADSEPLTAEDTASMNRAFGGKTTWTPKPVWVKFSDGTVVIAAIHNSPHGVQHVTNNNFAGHLCLHFPRTAAQVTSIGSYATSMQKAIDQAWDATVQKATRSN